MPLVPKNPADQITFYARRVPGWNSDPSAIGLNATTTAAMAQDVAAAEHALAVAHAARLHAIDATLAYRSAVRVLHNRGAAAIATIKAFAQSTGNENIYAAASIEPPRRGPRSLPGPHAPTAPQASIAADGSLTLSWEATTAGRSTGVFFQVFRGSAGQGVPREQIASTAQTTHTDPRPLAGCSCYAVRAVRGERASPLSTIISVSLPGAAIAPPGTLAASSSATGAAKSSKRGTSRKTSTTSTLLASPRSRGTQRRAA